MNDAFVLHIHVYMMSMNKITIDIFMWVSSQMTHSLMHLYCIYLYVTLINPLTTTVHFWLHHTAHYTEKTR